MCEGEEEMKRLLGNYNKATNKTEKPKENARKIAAKNTAVKDVNEKAVFGKCVYFHKKDLGLCHPHLVPVESVLGFTELTWKVPVVVNADFICYIYLFF